MRAELKGLMTSDIDPETYWPEEKDNFGFYVQATIGPENDEGGEIFGFQVCSPKWLLDEYDKSDIIFGRHMIVAFEYDFQAIEKRISSLCERTIGNDWNDLASKLARFGYWEFEDYQPAVSSST